MHWLLFFVRILLGKLISHYPAILSSHLPPHQTLDLDCSVLQSDVCRPLPPWLEPANNDDEIDADLEDRHVRGECYCDGNQRGTESIRGTHLMQGNPHDLQNIASLGGRCRLHYAARGSAQRCSDQYFPGST